MSSAEEKALLSRLRREWPAPAPEAVALSLRLIERIRAEMDAAGGSLPFDRYMELALYAPGLGYYSAGQARFGAAGDFVTAPVLAPLFSYTLARQVAQCLRGLGGGEVLEFGAGNGVMAAELLRQLARDGALPERYRILEVSAALRQEQCETLQARVPELVERVEWLDALPGRLTGVVLANEVLDALPVKRFRIAADTVEELHVVPQGGGFGWKALPASAELAETVGWIQARLGLDLSVGYTSEWSPRLAAWVGSIADMLERGVAFFIDYGYPRAEYYHPQRAMGTLMCHYRHRAHDDPLILPGLQDITAFVDFSATADAAHGAGLDVLGFAPQAQFLLGAGLLDLLAEADPGAGGAAALEMAQQVKRLTLPGDMGERFKVLAVGRGYDAELSGFSLADQRGRL